MLRCVGLPVLLLVTFCNADFKFLLLHTNDMHSHFQQTDRSVGMCESDNSTGCYGGFARLKAEVQKRTKVAEREGRPTVFLNAGDNFQGTPFYTFFKWPIVSKFVDMLGIHVMSLGNHEFDDGPGNLSLYLKNVSVRSVCTNLNLSQETDLVQPNLVPSVILNVSNVQIGVIGYLTPDTSFLSNVGKAQILSEIPSIRKEAQRLRDLNVTILIGLGHSGYLVDQQIAEAVEELDLVVGGHSHTFLYSGTPPDPWDKPKGPYPTVVTQASGKKVPVVQAYYGTKYLGYLELNFDDQGNLESWNGQPILLSGDLPQDPDVLAELQPYENLLHSKISKIVGYSDVFLNNENYACKLGECNMGNIIADSYVDYASYHYNASAIGLEQAGGMRASINTKTNVNHNGSITLGDVITVLPWGGKIVLKPLPGSVLLDALEFAVHRYENTSTGHVNEFLQVSGLKVVYNTSAEPGSRVASVLVRCADCPVTTYLPLNKTAIYAVTMPEYMATGGDGYFMFVNYSNSYVFDDVDYVVLSQYIERHSPINTTMEGRITFQNSTPSSSTTVSASWSLYLLALILSIAINYHHITAT